jgi:tight adherence protein C
MVEFFTNVQNLMSLGVGLLVFATLVTLLGSFGGGPRLEGRMKAVAARREELKRRSRQAIVAENAGSQNLRHSDDGFKKRVVEQLNLKKLLEDPKVADKMAQAGYRGPKPLTTFYFFRFSMPFVMLLIAAVYLFTFNSF